MNGWTDERMDKEWMDVQMNDVRRKKLHAPRWALYTYWWQYSWIPGYKTLYKVVWYSVCQGKTVLQLLKYIILKKPSLFELCYVKVLNQKHKKG